MEETEIGTLGIDFSTILNLSDIRFSSYGSMAQITEGDIIPDGELTFINKQGQIESASIYSLITNKKVLFLGVKGAFVNRCSLFMTRIIEKADEHNKHDEILCISVNDPFVMMGWELALKNHNKHIRFLADSTGAYLRSLGLLDCIESDLSYFGWGIRSRIFILSVEDRKVKQTHIEIPNPPKVFPDFSAYRRMSPIAVGDIIPNGQVLFIDYEDHRYQLRSTSIYSLATGKKIMLFGVPGAFETIFSTKYVHAIIEKADVLRSKGIQGIYCISVNDPSVMKGWEMMDFRNNGHVKFLADSTAAYVKSLGVDVDLSSMKLGIRSMRFCLVVNDLKVTVASFSKDFGIDILEYI